MAILFSLLPKSPDQDCFLEFPDLKMSHICSTSQHIDDLERPLVREETNLLASPKNDLKDHVSEHNYIKTEGNSNLPGAHGLSYIPRISSQGSCLTQGSNLALDIDTSEDLVGQTLKRPSGTSNLLNENLNYNIGFRSDDASFQGTINIGIAKQGSSLTLEVITGPSQGLNHSVQSTNTNKLPLTLGRVPPSDLLLRDSEVSGRHAMINWNLDKLKWEIVDMGSLNGTLVNSKAINHSDTGSRHWGNPIELESGDLITLGTTSHIKVQITSLAEYKIPFGVGIASDPMAMRRGGKKLPMEDVCYFQWPLPCADQFGVFGVCDGHGGADAAKSASKLLPEMVANILSDSSRKNVVLSQQDASDVLRDAFSQVEASLNHYYEGCTATLLLVWVDGHKNFFLQCANVGDSTCIANVNGKQFKMTEDHRITSYSERERIKETGQPLKDGDTRLCGLNLARMLGDKFLKEQDSRFSCIPYISPAVCLDQASEGFALLASDGLWDVLSTRKAVELVHQGREKYAGSSSSDCDSKDMAEKIAALLLNEAKALRTKDNTSVVYLDFSTIRTACKYES
ncbi:hypothetical protein V2J09_005596 [Rumex salicifolius]